MRLDLFIAGKFGFTRNKAKQYIESGLAEVNGRNITKVSFDVSESDIVNLIEDKSLHWVSRSAGKLDGFLDSLSRHCDERSNPGTKIESDFLTGSLRPSRRQEPIQIIWSHCLDVGSSTWGFTQVLLDRWASHVDAVDVGTDQLHESLRNDPQVTSYEQTDIREFESSTHYDIIVCDASFISLQGILPSILRFADTQTNILLLWKPQFEVGREHLRKTWVVKNEKIIEKKQKEWEEFIKSNNCEILQKEKSTVIGEAGNVEWMYWIKKCFLTQTET